MMRLIFEALLPSLGLFTSLASTADVANAPNVTVRNGTYVGRYSREYDQDFFLGIPYAKPAERFTVAQGLDEAWDGGRAATEYSPNCFNYVIEDQGQRFSEDCLYLNIIRPAGVRNTSDLPVAVWFYGGGFNSGGSAYKRYNMSFIVDHSVKMGTPIVAVSFNYRLAAYGFLSGGEATAAGISNNGLRDQRLALAWLQENIAAFGGSPAKVTIFGESAGATSVTLQVLAYNGRNDGLFRGAIGQSGFGTTLLTRFPSGLNATEEIDQVYDSVVAATSCAELLGQVGSLDCLRAVPREELDHAFNVTRVGPFPVVIDGDFLQDHPTSQFKKGHFVKVPLLIGINTDEGTDFVKSVPPINTDAEMRALVLSTVSAQKTDRSTDEIVDEILHLYPDDQAEGIPSLETWPYIMQPNDTYSKELGAQYRRNAAFQGDILMQWSRRRANIIWHENGIPSWSYRFNVISNGVPPSRGSSHFAEVAFVFRNFNGDGMRIPPFGGEEPYVSQAVAVADEMASAWINFFNNLDPNRGPHPQIGDYPAWPEYGTADSGGVGRNLVFDLGGSHVENDDFRSEGIGWFIDNMLPVFGH